MSYNHYQSLYDAMEGIETTPSSGTYKTKSQPSSLLTLDGPADGGSLLDYFDLPSPPSTPERPSFTSIPSGSSTPSSFRHGTPPNFSSSSANTSPFSSPSASPDLGCSPLSGRDRPRDIPHWPTAHQRIARLPAGRTSSHSGRTRSNSRGSVSSVSSASSSAMMDIDSGMISGNPSSVALQPVIRSARRTPYYPPNSSRNVERRAYMNRGPHYVQNWTPLSSLPRHVQLRIEEQMVRFNS